jgi:DHA1 family bicyclomycin/chloramphenicol resistance-like MFS transporter
MAGGMLFYGPLSDRFGRRPVLIAGVAVYVAATVVCLFSPSIEPLIAARFVQGLGACAGPVLGRAVVRDVFGAERAGRVLSYMSMAMAVAPAVGPVLGGYLEVAFGWRAAFTVLLAFSAACLAGLIFLLPETNPEKLPHATRFGALLRNYASLLGHRVYLGYVLCASFGYSGIFIYISGSSFVLIDGLGLSPDIYGYCFAAAVVGYMCGAFASGRLGKRWPLDRMIGYGLVICLTAGALAAGFAFAVAFAGVAEVATVVAPFALFLAGAGLVLPNSVAGSLGPFPRIAGSASALLGFVQMLVASGIGFTLGQLQDGTPRAMGALLLLVGLAGGLSYLLLVRGGKAAQAREGL